MTTTVRYALEIVIDPEHQVFQRVRAVIYALFEEEMASRLWGVFIELGTNIYRYAYGGVAGVRSVIWIRFFEEPGKVTMVLEDGGTPVTEDDRRRMLKAMAPRSWEERTDEFIVGDGLLLAQGSCDEMTLPQWDEVRQVNVQSVTVLRKPPELQQGDVKETMDRS